MSNAVRNVLFGGAGATTRLGDFGLMLLRVGVGLGIAVGHGWGKIYQAGHVGPPAQFMEGVAKMGLPAPTAMAWISALTEFLCGLLLAAGFLTRPAALMLVGNMAVAAFVAHQRDPLFSTGGPSKEFALLYLLPFLLFVFTGGGRFSADKMLRKTSAAAHA